MTDASLRRVAFAYLLTMRGTPQLYAGDEIAMKGGDDPDNRQGFSGRVSGRCAGCIYAGRAHSGAAGASLRGLQELTKLRREHPALECGGEQVLAANADWLVTLRDMGHERAERCEAKGSGERASGGGAASWEWRCDAGCSDEGDVGGGLPSVAKPLVGEGQVAASRMGIPSEPEWE